MAIDLPDGYCMILYFEDRGECPGLTGNQKNLPFQKMTIPTEARIALAMMGIRKA